MLRFILNRLEPLEPLFQATGLLYKILDAFLNLPCFPTLFDSGDRYLGLRRDGRILCLRTDDPFNEVTYHSVQLIGKFVELSAAVEHEPPSEVAIGYPPDVDANSMFWPRNVDSPHAILVHFSSPLSVLGIMGRQAELSLPVFPQKILIQTAMGFMACNTSDHPIFYPGQIR